MTHKQVKMCKTLEKIKALDGKCYLGKSTQVLSAYLKYLILPKSTQCRKMASFNDIPLNVILYDFIVIQLYFTNVHLTNSVA